MKKKVVSLVLTLCLIIACAFMLSSCDDGITEFTYVRYLQRGAEVVTLTTYQSNYEHMYVFVNQSAIPDIDDYEQEEDYRKACDDACIVSVQFATNLGVETIGEDRVITVDIDGYYFMQVSVKDEYYSQNKKVYLNGEAINYTLKTEIAGMKILTFQNCGLVKSNQTNYVNTIEYK